MRVCFIDYDLSVYGGTGTVIASLSEELKKFHSIYLYSITEPVADFYNKKDIVCKNLGAEKAKLLTMRKLYQKRVMQFLEDNEIDIALLIGGYSGIIALPFFERKKCKFIFCDHGALINQLDDKKITLIRLLMSVFSDKVVVLTERTLNDYRRLFRISSKRIQVIYNPIPQNALEHCAPCDLQSKKILSAGRFGKEKGYDMLVKVAAIVLPKHPDWEWHVYGDGATFEEIKQQINEIGIQNRLILQGSTDKMYELYKNYSMLVLPSYREGLPMVLLEAQVNHMPIVSFDVATGPAEIVHEGINGFLIPMYDIEKMAEKIEELMTDSEKRLSFSEHAMDNISDFLIDNVSPKWDQLFAELI